MHSLKTKFTKKNFLKILISTASLSLSQHAMDLSRPKSELFWVSWRLRSWQSLTYSTFSMEASLGPFSGSSSCGKGVSTKPHGSTLSSLVASTPSSVSSTDISSARTNNTNSVGQHRVACLHCHLQPTVQPSSICVSTWAGRRTSYPWASYSASTWRRWSTGGGASTTA